MKIGIDASRAFLEERTGTEEYSYQLIKNMTKIDASFCQFFLYARKGTKIDFELPDNFHLRIVEGKKLWTQIGLSLELLKHPVDALFVPSHSIPLVHPKKTIVTIHGLEYRNCSKCYSPIDRIFLEFNTFLSVIWAQKIIAPSLASKKDLIRFCKIDHEKITVISHGVEFGDCIFDPRIKCEDEAYILFIGRLEKRKNVINLIKAFNVLKTKVDLNKKKTRLILAGKAGFGYKDIMKEIKNSPFRDDIEICGYVTHEKKNELFKKAFIFIMPSFTEGFGLPILEAQAHNVPVLCSDIPPFKEVAKDSVLYFDPESFADISGKMANVFQDEKLCKNLAKKGSENVKNYNWKKCAKETMEFLMKV